MGKNTKRFLSAALCFALVCSLLSSAAPVQAFAVTQDEIDALKAQRDEITAQRLEKQAIVDELEEQKASVVDRKRAMDERNALALEQIELNEQEIALYDEMIAEKKLEVEQAEELEAEQLERYRERVRSMEENGNLDVLAVFLMTDDLSDLLTAIDDVGEIMESDKELEESYREARENTEAAQEEYEQLKIELEAKQDELREEQEELQADIDEATQLITDIENDLENRQAEYDEIMAAEEEANAEIEALVAELEEQRRAEEAAKNASNVNNGGSSGGTASGTASFVWPVASYVYITSRFGYRTHPITGKYSNHTGIDIASNQGTSVYAADGGTVTRASWYGGYGNCIIIDHGNGYMTLYGHLSGYAISEGDTVTQGQTIGYVGSTGNSTGPHLHFEVWQNGSRIDPEQFFSGLVFSADAGE